MRERERDTKTDRHLPLPSIRVSLAVLFIPDLKPAGALDCSDPRMGVMGFVGFLCADSRSLFLISLYTKSLS